MSRFPLIGLAFIAAMLVLFYVGYVGDGPPTTGINTAVILSVLCGAGYSLMMTVSWGMESLRDSSFRQWVLRDFVTIAAFVNYAMAGSVTHITRTLMPLVVIILICALALMVAAFAYCRRYRWWGTIFRKSDAYAFLVIQFVLLMGYGLYVRSHFIFPFH